MVLLRLKGYKCRRVLVRNHTTRYKSKYYFSNKGHLLQYLYGLYDYYIYKTQHTI